MLAELISQSSVDSISPEGEQVAKDVAAVAYAGNLRSPHLTDSSKVHVLTPYAY